MLKQVQHDVILNGSFPPQNRHRQNRAASRCVIMSRPRCPTLG